MMEEALPGFDEGDAAEVAHYLISILSDIGVPRKKSKKPQSLKKLDQEIDGRVLYAIHLLSSYGWARQLARVQEEGGELGVRRLRQAVGDVGFSEKDEIENLIFFGREVEERVLKFMAIVAPGKLVK